jgi:hypothetical protein
MSGTLRDSASQHRSRINIAAFGILILFMSAAATTVALPPGWEERVDPKSGRPFYIKYNWICLCFINLGSDWVLTMLCVCVIMIVFASAIPPRLRVGKGLSWRQPRVWAVGVRLSGDGSHALVSFFSSSSFFSPRIVLFFLFFFFVLCFSF